MALIDALQELVDSSNDPRNTSTDVLEFGPHGVGGLDGWRWLIAALLKEVSSGSLASGGGAVVVNGVPVAYDSRLITYIGATNNIDTVEFKTGGPAGTTVATLTITYVNAGAADDDLVETTHLT